MYYPLMDNVIIGWGPIALRWYGVSYLAGFLVCWWLGKRRALRLSAQGEAWSADDVSDLVFYGAMGAVLGGRIGYVLFYGFDKFLADPVWLVRLWDGGMSFHGGLLGVLAGFALFGYQTGRGFFQVTDFMAPLCPPGLGFGRLANFVNTELPGRVTDSALGFHYPCSAVVQMNKLCFGRFEEVTRHASPLYQAFTEGLLLFLLLWWFSRKTRARGAISGMFLLGYGGFRFSTEFFRQPDFGIGFVAFDWLSMGQVLSLPMIIAGIVLLLRNRPVAASG